MTPPWRSATAPARTIRTHSHTIIARITRSGGRKPAVVRADALAQALPRLFCRLSPGVLADAVAMALPQPLLWRSALNGNRIVFRIAGSRTTGG